MRLKPNCTAVRPFSHGHSISNRERPHHTRKGIFPQNSDYQQTTNSPNFREFRTVGKIFQNTRSIWRHLSRKIATVVPFENRQATPVIVAAPVGKYGLVFLILDKFLVFKEKTFIFASSKALIVQWIERRFPKPLIRVRFPVGVLHGAVNPHSAPPNHEQLTS